MIRSMTGFGDATGQSAPSPSSNGDTGGAEYFVEARSVNAKYFKAQIRLPEELQPLEPEIELAAKHTLDRGTVTIRVTMTDRSTAAALQINHRALDRYVEQLGDAEAIKTGAVAMDAAALLNLPGVLQPPGGEDERLQRTREALLPLVGEAAEKLSQMRAREGQELDADLRKQLDSIEGNVAAIQTKAPVAVKAYEQRLRQRIDSLLQGTEASVGDADLIREVAVHAEKTDVAEEISRLSGHVAHFRERLDDSNGDPVGRTLDFLSQEMLREANTIASKSQDAEISQRVVDVKGAIDRIKEQVQNVL
ncbi:MAG: YicC/YloC family endoribonuclease [Planctomycetota bacterium]